MGNPMEEHDASPIARKWSECTDDYENPSYVFADRIDHTADAHNFNVFQYLAHE